MQWEELTSDDLAQAVRQTNLCVVPLGVLERHSTHLPLGTDYLAAHRVAVLAAQREPAVVFPPVYFGQINESRHCPGSVAFSPDLLWEMLQNLCDEIGRNGFTKILLHNGHGGNIHWLHYFCQSALHRRKPYTLYLSQWLARPDLREEVRRLCPTPGGHAGDFETSEMLAVAPELVRMDRVPEKPGDPLGRLKHLQGPYTGIWWYADHPDQYSGDGRPSTVEKGKKLLELLVRALADVIRQVKGDAVVPALEKEFFDRADRPV